MKRTALVLLAMMCCAAAPKPADPLATAAADAAKAGALKDLAGTVEAELKPLLADLEHIDAQRLTDLASLREFGRYFSRLDPEKLSADDTATLTWLADKPQLMNTLMLAVGETDAPDKVIALLNGFHADQKDALEDFADLAAAMCVVWDAPEESASAAEEKPDGDRPRWLMRYYTRQQFRFDLKQLPWQLTVYAVDNVVSQEEIAWAQQRYMRHGAIGGAYFDVPYDYDRYYGTTDLGKAGEHTTLQELMRLGGLCGDQAYFATQVARSVGVPAVICTGRGGSGEVAHAWVGYLEKRNDRVQWNFDEGRYPEQQYFKADILDPQTRQTITDADLSLLAELQNSSRPNRMASAALCKVVDLLEEDRRADAYMKAINISPGNRIAWHRLADLGANRKLTDQQANALNSVVEKFAAQKYPDFAFAVLRKSISGRGTQQQMEALNGMRKMFAQRPDLLAQIRLEQGDLYRRDKQMREALGAYTEVLDRYSTTGPVVMDALKHIDELMAESNQTPQLVSIYQKAWQRMPQPGNSALAQTTPFYIVGTRYVELLKQAGQQAQANAAQSRLDSLTAEARTNLERRSSKTK